MKIYTIGYTKKSAKTFFELLIANGIERLIDIRLNNTSQLSGFTKKNDLKYFLNKLVGIEYYHFDFLAPSKEIRDAYRENKDWEQYAKQFRQLMEKRRAFENINKKFFVEKSCCLLCSEATPEKCHRHLVSEKLKERWEDVETIHI